MILVDTSIWVDHLRAADTRLVELLSNSKVLTHPFVVGEIALGNLRNRKQLLGDLRRLPEARLASNDEVFAFITSSKLFGSGIGYVDAHLLAAVRLNPGASLWTRDKRLSALAGPFAFTTG